MHPCQLPIRRDGRRNNTSAVRAERAAASDATLVFEIASESMFLNPCLADPYTSDAAAITAKQQVYDLQVENY